MTVRSAEESDFAALAVLMRGYCDFYEALPPDEKLAEMAAALIACPDSEGLLLVAADDLGEAVGFAAVGWKWSSLRGARVAVMEDLFVAPESRGAGHADALITACADRVRQLGAPAMLWVTAHDNKRAQAVYDRSGATGAGWLEYELEL